MTTHTIRYKKHTWKIHGRLHAKNEGNPHARVLCIFHVFFMYVFLTTKFEPVEIFSWRFLVLEIRFWRHLRTTSAPIQFAESLDQSTGAPDQSADSPDDLSTDSFSRPVNGFSRPINGFRRLAQEGWRNAQKFSRKIAFAQNLHTRKRPTQISKRNKWKRTSPEWVERENHPKLSKTRLRNTRRHDTETTRNYEHAETPVPEHFLWQQITPPDQTRQMPPPITTRHCAFTDFDVRTTFANPCITPCIDPCVVKQTTRQWLSEKFRLRISLCAIQHPTRTPNTHPNTSDKI